MLRTDIINRLIEKHKYKSYLEIGIGDAVNYRLINCENKSNVDPCFDNYDSQATAMVINRCTSDEFFSKNTEKFDIIFIDGLHEYEQVYRDIINSLNALQQNAIQQNTI